MDSSQDCKDRFHIIVDDQCLCDFGVPCDCCETFSEISKILSIQPQEDQAVKIQVVTPYDPVEPGGLCRDDCDDPPPVQKKCGCGYTCAPQINSDAPSIEFCPGHAPDNVDDPYVDVRVDFKWKCVVADPMYGQKFIQCEGGDCCPVIKGQCADCILSKDTGRLECSTTCGACKECIDEVCKIKEGTTKCGEQCCEKSKCEKCDSDKDTCVSECNSCQECKDGKCENIPDREACGAPELERCCDGSKCYKCEEGKCKYNCDICQKCEGGECVDDENLELCGGNKCCNKLNCEECDPDTNTCKKWCGPPENCGRCILAPPEADPANPSGPNDPPKPLIPTCPVPDMLNLCQGPQGPAVCCNRAKCQKCDVSSGSAQCVTKCGPCETCSRTKAPDWGECKPCKDCFECENGKCEYQCDATICEFCRKAKPK